MTSLIDFRGWVKESTFEANQLGEQVNVYIMSDSHVDELEF